MKDQSKDSETQTEPRNGNPRRDPELCDQTTERWFFTAEQREQIHDAYERRCQDRSLQEFS